MIARIERAVHDLLTASLPALFGGGTPAVALAFVTNPYTFDPRSADAEAGEPRVDDRQDRLAFDPAHAAGPYALTKPPVAGARRVWLTNAAGDRVPLTTAEVVWDPHDPRTFTLAPRPGRDLTGFDALLVLYGVAAVFVKRKLAHEFALQLQSSDAAKLADAEALAVAALELNRKALADAAAQRSDSGDYAAEITVTGIALIGGESTAADKRVLRFSAALELKAMRALSAGEGT
ncbi:MAG TPA: hypothetical protein VE826_07240, partial [Dongiaceae bacterium]|nr:hypothetical protein [Dongiaceae bacterium]